MAGEMRCDRCGTMVEAGRVICPNCDNVVDLSFLNDIDDDAHDPLFATEKFLAVAAADHLPSTQLAPASVDVSFQSPPTEPLSPASAPVRARTRAISSGPSRAAVAASFLDENTEADIDDEQGEVRSQTDALILGDAGSIVESLWIEAESLSSPAIEAFRSEFGEVSRPVDVEAANDFLTAPTYEGRRDVVPVQVYVGADIARTIEADSILRRTSLDTSRLQLSTFEQFVLEQIDGVRPVARIQKRMGLGDADLRIALALLVDKKIIERAARAAVTRPASSEPEPLPLPEEALEFVDAPRARMLPAMVAAPAVTASSLPPAPVAVPARPVDEAGRSRALTLHTQCLRDLKGGTVARAFALAKMAHDAAPDVALYREVLDSWDRFVAGHRVADDARLHAQAVSAETSGDVGRAVTLLKAAAAANPSNAGVWNRLGLLLATRMNDIDGALQAMTRAIEIAPDDATFKNNFGKIAALSDRRSSASGEPPKSGLFGRLFRR